MHIKDYRWLILISALGSCVAAIISIPSAVTYCTLVASWGLFGVYFISRDTIRWVTGSACALLVATPVVGIYQFHTSRSEIEQYAGPMGLLMVLVIGAAGCFAMTFGNQARTQRVGKWTVGIAGIGIPTLWFCLTAMGFLGLTISLIPGAMYGIYCYVKDVISLQE